MTHAVSNSACLRTCSPAKGVNLLHFQGTQRIYAFEIKYGSHNTHMELERILFDLVSQSNIICEGLARALIKQIKRFLDARCAKYVINVCGVTLLSGSSSRRAPSDATLRLICAFRNASHSSRCAKTKQYNI